MSDHYTKQSDIALIPDGPDAIEEARKMHRLATADPEPERGDGQLTGTAHEEKYGLERASVSAEVWRAAGVHPTENRALQPGDEGFEDVQTTEAGGAPETTAAVRATKK